LEVHYSNGSKIKRLGIYLTPKWLSVHLNEDVKRSIDQLTSQGVLLIDKMIIDEKINILLEEIFTIALNGQKQGFQLKTMIVKLMDDFFKTYLKGQPVINLQTVIPEADLIKLKPIEDLLKEDLDSFPSIQKLAVIAQMCGTKLKQRFKQVYGCPLYEYYNKNRLEKAKGFLATGISPKEAGLRIGFSDASNFTKAFKKEYGFTPGVLYERSAQKQ
jgi:AraC-like DNA-binding protein